MDERQKTEDRRQKTESAARFIMHTDLSCPFCYLGESVLEGLKSKWGFETQWVPFELHPEVPPGGAELTEKGQERLAHLWRSVLGLAAALKVPFNPPPVIINTRRALGVLVAVAEEDVEAAERLRWAMYRAYFIDGVNLSDPEVLVGLCAEVLGEEGAGLMGAVEAAARNESHKGRLAQLKEEGFDAMVMGVPVFRPFVEGEERLDRRVMGAQPEEILEKILEDLGVERLEAVT